MKLSQKAVSPIFLKLKICTDIGKIKRKRSFANFLMFTACVNIGEIEPRVYFHQIFEAYSLRLVKLNPRAISPTF